MTPDEIRIREILSRTEKASDLTLVDEVRSSYDTYWTVESVTGTEGVSEVECVKKEDAEFIANAKSDINYLILLVTEQQALISELRNNLR